MVDVSAATEHGYVVSTIQATEQHVLDLDKVQAGYFGHLGVAGPIVMTKEHCVCWSFR